VAIPYLLEGRGKASFAESDEYYKKLEEAWKAEILPVSGRSPPSERGNPLLCRQLWLRAGRKDLALDALEESVREHEFFVFPIKTDPTFAPLRERAFTQSSRG
jgi:hypothetical protein